LSIAAAAASAACDSAGFLSAAAAAEVGWLASSSPWAWCQSWLAAEAAASDAMDFGLIVEEMTGVKNEGCSTAVAGPMSVMIICAQQDVPA
jgi:hypothetical protein